MSKGLKLKNPEIQKKKNQNLEELNLFSTMTQKIKPFEIYLRVAEKREITFQLWS